jgi:hypothetical protein
MKDDSWLKRIRREVEFYVRRKEGRVSPRTKKRVLVP